MKEHRTKKDLDRCRRCRFHGGHSAKTTCDYILYKQEPRGCEAGLKCTRFESGAKNRKEKFIDEETRNAMKAEQQSRNEMIGYKGEALKRMHLK